MAPPSRLGSETANHTTRAHATARPVFFYSVAGKTISLARCISRIRDQRQSCVHATTSMHTCGRHTRARLRQPRSNPGIPSWARSMGGSRSSPRFLSGLSERGRPAEPVCRAVRWERVRVILVESSHTRGLAQRTQQVRVATPPFTNGFRALLERRRVGNAASGAVRCLASG